MYNAMLDLAGIGQAGTQLVLLALLDGLYVAGHRDVMNTPR